MKRLIYTLILVTVFANGYAQKINYFNNLNDALQKAQQDKKPVFIFVAQPLPSVRPAGMPVFKSGLDDAEVCSFYNKNFISLKFNLTDSAYSDFRRKYPTKIDGYPAYIFLDDKGELLYKKTGFNTSYPKHYTGMGNEVLALTTSGKTITDYKNKHKNGKLSHDELKEFISLRQNLGLLQNNDLLDEYVDGLTIQAFNDYKQVLFILRAGPYAYGKTYNLCFTNRKLVDSIFKTEALEVRREINNRIIINTRNQAILKKDINMAQQTAAFVRGTWNKNYNRGTKEYAEEMLHYYKVVKDTANYYRQAIYLYDAHYMKLSVDSINKLRQMAQTSNQQNMMKRLKEINPNAKINEGNSPGAIKLTGAVPEANRNMIMSSSSSTNIDVPGVLNNAAYTFYTMGTRNPEYLTKAMLWCKRSIELSPDKHPGYDTMAHLLYRLGFVDEAIVNQKKAIELAQKENISNAATYIPTLKKELVKMQERKL